MCVRVAGGVTTAIYIGKFGKNLQLSWRTFVKPVLDGTTFTCILGLAFLYGFVPASNAWDGKVLAFLGGMAVAAISLALLVALAGLLIKQNYLQYFFEEPNWFNIEDVCGMNLTIHKAMLRAVDNNGIDISKLRVKQEFVGGKKNIKG